MDKQLLEEFFGLCNQYNPFHGFGSVADTYAANDLLTQIRELKEAHPELKPIDKAFFGYWYKGFDKPEITDYILPDEYYHSLNKD